ncbi:hypothetical protein [Methylophaga sp.]|nr:hypothetical protein [Methylophaga sp.]MDO8826372.1 hypothetical protein [Methylophaga sp.]
MANSLFNLVELSPAIQILLIQQAWQYGVLPELPEKIAYALRR